MKETGACSPWTLQHLLQQTYSSHSKDMQNRDFYQQLSSLGHESGLSSNFATEYKLRVEDLSPSVNEAQLHDIFSPHGRVVRVTIFEDRKWIKGLNYAFISFLYHADLWKAIKVCNGLYIEGSKITVSVARRASARSPPVRVSSSPSIGVGQALLSSQLACPPIFPNPIVDCPNASVQYNVQSYATSFSSYSAYQAPYDPPQTRESGIFSSSLFTARSQGTVYEPHGGGSAHRAGIPQMSTQGNHGNVHITRETSGVSQHSITSSTGTVRNRRAEGTFPASPAAVNGEVFVTTHKPSLSSSSSYNTITSFCKRFLGFRSNNRSSQGSPKDLPIPETFHNVHSQKPLPMLPESVAGKVERNSKMTITPQDASNAEPPASNPLPVTDHQSQMTDQTTHEPKKSSPAQGPRVRSPLSPAPSEEHHEVLASASSFTHDTSEVGESSKHFSPSSGGSISSMPSKQEDPLIRPQQTLGISITTAHHLPPLYTEEVADVTGQVQKTSETPSFEGIYSFVYPGSYYGLSVAIKVLRAVSTVSAMRRKLRREMQTWWAMNGHPNILPLFGFHEDFGVFGAMISPWYRNGNSSDYLRTRWVPPAKRIELFLQVASVVAYLHAYDPQIIHGDLKPTNILIDDHRNARVCDFGLARVIAEYGDTGLTTTTAYTGTARYLAYELVESDETKLPTAATDVHALACVGFAFLYLDVPYAHRQGNQLTYIIRDIMTGVPPAKRPEGTTDPTIALLWYLLEDCWALDPEDRPPASAVVEFLIQHGKELEVALTIPF